MRQPQVRLQGIASHEEIEKVLETIDGKLFAESSDFCNPRVQFSDDMSM